jgi:GNAT superfamily N-acetyltransferase
VPLDAASVLWERRISAGHYLAARRILDTCPPLLQDALAARYASIAGPVRRHWAVGDGRVADSWSEAYRDLRATGAELRQVRPDTAFDDDAIEAAADRAARFCMGCRTLAAAIEYSERQGMTLPVGPNVTPRSLRRRLVSPDWWRRRLRKRLTRACEELFRRLGFVRRQASAYVSGDALARIRAANVKSQRWLAETSVVCEDTGEVIPLAKIAAGSLANPTLRRGELMLRARGFQETAEALGHRCLMVTATCPSAFHPWLHDGDRNGRFNGATPRAAQAWLNQHWARARAALKRRDVLYYGFRAAEPHHDATPHWHMILYVAPDSLEVLKTILTRVWLKDFSDEAGALLHRIKFSDEDPTKGSGVGYLAKYVAKNIDGAGSIGAEVSDESGRLVSDDAQHAIAWARLHGIRQFQQLGGPAVTLWRELRRVREPCEWPPIEALRLCTDHSERGQPAGESVAAVGSTQYHTSIFNEAPASRPPLSQTDGEKISATLGPSWSRFIEQLGGIAASLRASRALFDKAEPRCIDSMGRKVMRLTRWGELPGPIVVGVQLVWQGRIRRLATRVHVWFLIFVPQRGTSALGPVAITVRGAVELNEPAGWTNPHESSQAPPSVGLQ